MDIFYPELLAHLWKNGEIIFRLPGKSRETNGLNQKKIDFGRDIRILI